MFEMRTGPHAVVARLAVIAVAAAALTTGAAGSAQAAIRHSSHRTVGLSTFERRVNSAVHRTSTATFSISVRGGGRTLLTGRGAVRYKSTGTDLRFSADLGDLQLKYVLLNNVLYVELPQSPAGRAGRPWVRISSAGTDATSKQLAASLDRVTSADISKIGDMFFKTRVRRSGHAVIGGIRTTKYVLVLNAAAIRAQIRRQLRSFGPTAVRRGLAGVAGVRGSITLYVDAQWLPRRVVSVLKLKGAPRIQTTVSYGHWGAPVRITAPPAALIGTLPGVRA